MDRYEYTPDHRASPLPLPQHLVLIILSILFIHVQSVENRINGTWSLFPIGHEGRLFYFRMIGPAQWGAETG